ncbi:coiled-coil domain-containing protein 39-like isoform X1 [Centruroides sculpturatus]|uniref:coiled-coil domain-containing protein 39-like isoform X1 n=2 Tax=Centruroides sculpturatus TaxID=218467 RepID=UPI000C6E418B|nr:coiled-coil domain-containing protein 39-like isoform X1 [Centruroides sculpturatus]
MIERVHKLQENLEESNGKLEESNKQLTEMKAENLKLKEEHQEQLHKATKLRLDSVSEVVSKMDEIKEENRYLQLQLESNLKTQELQSKKIGKLQDAVESLEEQIKQLEITHEEKIETMKQEQKELIKEMKYLKQQEILKIKTEMEEREKSLNENLSRFEEEKSQLKQEIIKLNGKLLEEKTKTEDLLQQQRLELHKDMNEQCSHLLVKLHSLQKENDNHFKIISQQKFEIAQLQSAKEYLQVENDNQSKLIDQLKEQIACKDAELRRLITNYEEENKEKHKELMNEKENQKILYNKINYLETKNVKLDGMQQKLSNAIKCKDYEIQGLKEKLEQKEVELRQLQKNEIHRTAQLYSAFKNFISNTPHSDIKDSFVSDETNTSLPNP